MAARKQIISEAIQELNSDLLVTTLDRLEGDGDVHVCYLSPGMGQVEVTVYDPDDPGTAVRLHNYYTGAYIRTHVHKRVLCHIQVDKAVWRRTKPKAWVVSNRDGSYKHSAHREFETLEAAVRDVARRVRKLTRDLVPRV